MARVGISEGERWGRTERGTCRARKDQPAKQYTSLSQRWYSAEAPAAAASSAAKAYRRQATQ